MATTKKTTRKPVESANRKTEGLAKRAMHYIEDKYEHLDKAKVAKYAAVAAIVVIGASRSSAVRKLTSAIATGAAAKYLSEKLPAMQKAFAKA